MLLETLWEIAKWLFGSFWFRTTISTISLLHSVQSSSVDLNEIARQERREKIKRIDERYQELSLEGWQKNRPQAQCEVEIKSEEKQIIIKDQDTKFTFEICQHDDIQTLENAHVLQGRINDETTVAIKKFSNKNDFDHEMEILKVLKNDEKFLKCFFTFGIQLCMIFENYTPLEKFDEPFEAKSAVKQISGGIKFLHDEGITHGDLNEMNIAVLQRYRTTFKIINFNRKSKFGREYFKCSDVYKFGCLIRHIHQRSKEVCTDYDEILIVDLVAKIIAQDEFNRPTIDEITNHPYFFNDQNTLDFIVECCKILDNRNHVLNQIFHQKLQKNYLKICDKDWRSRVDKKVLEELNKIRTDLGFGENEINKSIITLVKTIRNLVMTTSFKQKL